MKTLHQVLSKFTARNIRDLINRSSANCTSYKIMCCSGILNDKDLQSIEREPKNIHCSDTCRGLVINYRTQGKNNRFICNECASHIHINGYSELEKVTPAPVIVKEKTSAKRKVAKNENII